MKVSALQALRKWGAGLFLGLTAQAGNRVAPLALNIPLGIGFSLTTVSKEQKRN